MKKAFYLSTCDTCKRILKELDTDSLELREIKSSPISEEELEDMYRLTNSYEALFSRRARKFRERGLHEQTLTESDYKNLLLEEYTFLKRPVFVFENDIFVGNSKKTVESVKNFLKQ